MATAEKIYSASTSEDAADGRLAERLARLIEDDIVASNVPVGGMMGSLRDLSERYTVGRAAVREAVALLERRGLGRLRPGPAGGFVVGQPEADAISAELASYFHMIGVTSQQVIDAREAVDLMAAGLAARQGHAAADLEALTKPRDGRPPYGWHLEVRAEVARLSGEPVIVLFTDCLNYLIARFTGACKLETGWLGQALENRERLCQAIAGGNADGAMAAAATLYDALDDWLLQAEEAIEPPALATARMADDRTLSTLVARRIANEILRNPTAGKRLGSEWDLCERFSVSRATLRQAIRQLQDSGLVECRRGRGNGLVVRDPRGTGSIRLVLAYLISRHMDPLKAGTFLFQLNRHIPVLALAVSRAELAQRRTLRKAARARGCAQPSIVLICWAGALRVATGGQSGDRPVFALPRRLRGSLPSPFDGTPAGAHAGGIFRASSSTPERARRRDVGKYRCGKRAIRPHHARNEPHAPHLTRGATYPSPALNRSFLRWRAART